MPHYLHYRATYLICHATCAPIRRKAEMPQCVPTISFVKSCERRRPHAAIDDSMNVRQEAADDDGAAFDGHDDLFEPSLRAYQSARHETPLPPCSKLRATKSCRRRRRRRDEKMILASSRQSKVPTPRHRARCRHALIFDSAEAARRRGRCAFAPPPRAT